MGVSQPALSPIPEYLRLANQGPVRPPRVRGPLLLPTDELEWADFERLCLAIAERVDGMKDPRLYGWPGQRQEGIDIYARDDAGAYVVYQVRRIKDVRARAIRNAVAHYMSRGRVFNARRLVYCLGCSARDTSVHDELADLRRVYADLEIELYDQESISRELRVHPDVVSAFFGEEWAVRFCGRRSSPIRARQSPPSDVLLRGPMESLGLAPTLASVETLSPGDAAGRLGEVARRLSEAGYTGHSARIRLRQAGALQTSGRVDQAFDVAFEVAVERVGAGDIWLPGGAMKVLDQLAEQVDQERKSRLEALRTRAAWYEDARAIGRLRESFLQLVKVESLWAAEVGVWFVEAALADHREDAAADALDQLRMVRSLAVEPWRTRLDVAMAEIHELDRLGGLLDGAIERRMDPRTATLVCLRGGRQLAMRADHRGAVAAYRRAVEFATESQVPGAARAALQSISSIHVLLSTSDVHEMFEANELARLLPELPGILPVAGSARQSALGALATAKPAEARMTLRRYLLESRVQGDLAGELGANALLGELLVRVGVTGEGVVHLVRAGRSTDAGSAAQGLTTTVVDLTRESASDAPWERAAAHHVTATQGALLSPDQIEARAPVIMDDLLRGHVAGFGPNLQKAAMKAVAGSAIVFPRKLLPRLLQVTDSWIDRTDGRSRVTDDEMLEALRVIHITNPRLRAEVVRQLARCLTNDTLAPLAVPVIAKLNSRPLVRVLRDLADQANQHAIRALADLGMSHPALKPKALAELDRILRYPVGMPKSTFEIGPPFGMAPGLVRQLDRSQRLELAWHLLAIAGDGYELGVNRTAALIGIFNLRSSVTKHDRARILEGIRQCDPDTADSPADQIQLASQHPLSRFQIRFGGPSELADTILLAAAAYAAERPDAALAARNVAVSLRIPEHDTQRLALAIRVLHERHLFFDARELAATDSVDLRATAVLLWTDAPQSDPALGLILASDRSPVVRAQLAWCLGAIVSHDASLGRELAGHLANDIDAWVRRAAAAAGRTNPRHRH